MTGAVLGLALAAGFLVAAATGFAAGLAAGFAGAVFFGAGFPAAAGFFEASALGVLALPQFWNTEAQ